MLPRVLHTLPPIRSCKAGYVPDWIGCEVDTATANQPEIGRPGVATFLRHPPHSVTPMSATKEHREAGDADRTSAQMPDALIQLARLLARQSAREDFAALCNAQQPKET